MYKSAKKPLNSIVALFFLGSRSTRKILKCVASLGVRYRAGGLVVLLYNNAIIHRPSKLWLDLRCYATPAVYCGVRRPSYKTEQKMGMVAYFKVLEDRELRELESNPESVEDILFPIDDDEDPFEGQVCLGKEWHALHYILTGLVELDGTAIGNAILGGVEIGPNLGYGQARLLMPEVVKEISEALQFVDIQEKINTIKTRTSDINDIYGEISTEEFAIQFYRDIFRQLNNMYGSASKSGKAVLAYLA